MRIRHKSITVFVIGIAAALIVGMFASSAAIANRGTAPGAGSAATAAKAKAKSKSKKKKKSSKAKKLAKKIKSKKAKCKKEGKVYKKGKKGKVGTCVAKTHTEVQITTSSTTQPPPPPPPPPGETAAQQEMKQIEEIAKGGTKAIESGSEIPEAPAFTKAQLTAEPAGNWISSQGGGATGDHDSQLNEITTANAHELKADWMEQLDDSGVGSKYSQEASMATWDGVGYYVTGADDTFAISLNSGKILWIHPGELPETIADVCCGWDNRGVALGEGRVYTALLTGSIEALNQKTGDVEWKTELGEPAEGFTVTSQPLYYEGLVFVGPVGSEYGVRGFMEAFNAKTGALVWKHYNIPAPGEFGHETWPTDTTCKECDEEWQHGGATTWNAPTVSKETGDIYYSTANAGGLGINGGDSGGATRSGEDLWTVSMLALNYKTGEFVWGYQGVHHDIWDYDMSTQPIMIETEVGGKKIEGIVQANKDGYAYFVNAENGVPVFPIEEKAVPQDPLLEATFPTQPIPKMPQFVPPASAEEISLMQKSVNTSTSAAFKTYYENVGKPRPTVVAGGYAGLDVFTPFNEVGEPTLEVSSGGGSGAQASNEAYDPETHLYYVCAHISYSAGDKESQKQVDQGETFGIGKSGVSGSATGSTTPKGYLTAYNMETGEIAWQKSFKEECYYGPTVTKGGVLFYAGAFESKILALNAANGEELWHWEIGGGSSPISVYEFNGEERVSVEGGGSLVGPVHGDDLWQFSLKGTDTTQYGPGDTPAPAHTLGADGE